MNNMSKTPRVDAERKYFNSNSHKWTHEQQAVYHLAEILEMELGKAKENLMKCGYDEINQICNQRDEARANLDQLKTELREFAGASRTEINQLRADLDTVNNAREAVRGQYHRAIDECAELRAELSATKIDIAKRSGKGMDDLFRIQDLEQERDKLKNQLAQSEANFNALLKTNGSRIDENAELKSENQILQEYLNQSNARISKIENDIKDLKLKF